MIKKILSIGISCMLLSTSLMVLPIVSLAEGKTNSYEGDGVIEFEGDYDQVIVDPENPTIPVDPGETPKTDGKLRIDFVPKINFGKNKISSKDTTYMANGQLFHGETDARGNFVQVSDYRATGNGWTLLVRQETQFKNDQTLFNELNGGVLSFDKSWVNSTRDLSKAPEVSKEIVRINNIGQSYELAQANVGKGEGTWSIVFGASDKNSNNQGNTLKPKTDEAGKPILSTEFDNKQVVENSAVTLSVPGATKIDPVPYKTVLTWILAELP